MKKEISGRVLQILKIKWNNPLKRLVSEGELVPTWYGYSYHELNRDTIVCYPVPLNILVGLVRNFYYRLRFPDFLTMNAFDSYLYRRGKEAGRIEVINELVGTTIIKPLKEDIGVDR